MVGLMHFKEFDFFTSILLAVADWPPPHIAEPECYLFYNYLFSFTLICIGEIISGHIGMILTVSFYHHPSGRPKPPPVENPFGSFQIHLLSGCTQQDPPGISAVKTIEKDQKDQLKTLHTIGSPCHLMRSGQRLNDSELETMQKS